MIIYRKLIGGSFKDWTASEKLMYSYFVNKVIIINGSFTESADGNVRIDKSEISFNTWYSVGNINKSDISKRLGLTRQTVISTIKALEEKRLVKGCNVYVLDSIARGGYANIDDCGLKGEILLFYVWYKPYCEERGEDYTLYSTLADYYGVTYDKIAYYIKTLVQKGFLERKRNGEQYYTCISDKQSKKTDECIGVCESMDAMQCIIPKTEYRSVNIPMRGEECQKQRKISVPKESKSKTYLMIDVANGFVKIGKSKNPKFRERTLQSEKPTIELYAVKDKDIEKQLHSLYADRNVRGEWYNLSQKEIREIVRNYKFAKI